MVYDRNSRGGGPRDADYGRDYGSGRDYTSTSARDYAAAGSYDRDDYGARDYGSRDFGGGRDYGQREYGNQSYRRYDQPNRFGGGQRDYYNRGDDRDGRREWHGSYGADGRHFEDVGRYRNADDDNRRGGQYGGDGRGRYGRAPQGYDYDERGFLQRAGDEVRSWFGDDDAERRREADARYDERYGSGRHDDDYRQWRHGQMSQLDRDYHEYRQENRSKFENEFSSWRTTRQGQRDQLREVKEHAEVLGSDGAHVGTVDKVRDDRILLTKNDAEAGGRHHSIPSRWIDKVESGKVTLSKTAAEAKAAWEDEDRNSAMFGYGDNQRGTGQQTGTQRDDGQTRSQDGGDGGRDAQGRMLNRSFSGTY